MEVPHTNFTEVTRMVLVEVRAIRHCSCRCSLGYSSKEQRTERTEVRGWRILRWEGTISMYIRECKKRNVPVMVGTTSETTTSRVLTVLAYTTMTGGDVTAVFAGVRETGRHLV